MSELLAYIVVGLTAGSVYGLAGVGLVLTYKTSGIFNFAHGAIAALGAYAFYELRDLRGLPWPLAGLICLVVVGPVAGLLLERLSRGLRGASPAARIVATVGLLLAVQGTATLRYGAGAEYFAPFLPSASLSVLGTRVGVDQLVIVALAAAGCTGLAVLLRTTRTGAAMRAVVDDPALLALAGTDPVRVQRASWMIGATFAVVSGVLIAPSIGLDAVLLTFLVVQAFGAAALGRFSSLVGTHLGGLAIGVAAALATGYLGTVPLLSGLPASLPFLVLFVVLVVTPRDRLPAVGPVATAARGAARAAWGARRGRAQQPAVVGAASVAALLVVPFVVGARLPVFISALALSIAFLSLALLVNLSGQVSLCHAAFAALGATTFAQVATGTGLPWVICLLLGGLAVVPLGLAVALPAIRLDGLYLALATFGLAVLLEKMVYPSALMFGSTGTRLAPRPGGLADDRSYYYVVLVVALAAVALVLVLRRGRLGRLLAALGDAPVALDVLGASTQVTKALVLCISAFLAGIAGGLLAALGGSVSGVAFSPLQSLLWLAVLAIGGRGLVGTAAIAALVFAVLPTYGRAELVDYQPVFLGAVAVAAALAAGRAGPRGRLAGRVEAAAAGSAWRRTSSPVRQRVPVGAGAGR